MTKNLTLTHWLKQKLGIMAPKKATWEDMAVISKNADIKALAMATLLLTRDAKRKVAYELLTTMYAKHSSDNTADCSKWLGRYFMFKGNAKHLLPHEPTASKLTLADFDSQDSHDAHMALLSQLSNTTLEINERNYTELIAEFEAEAAKHPYFSKYLTLPQTIGLHIWKLELLDAVYLYALAYTDTEYLRPALTVPVEAYKQAFNEWKQAKEAQTV